jgi:hypothetical protein
MSFQWGEMEKGVGAVKRLSDTVAELAMQRVASLLADRVADRVVTALMEAGFDRQFADSLLRAGQREVEETKEE